MFKTDMLEPHCLEGFDWLIGGTASGGFLTRKYFPLKGLAGRVFSRVLTDSQVVCGSVLFFITFLV